MYIFQPTFQQSDSAVNTLRNNASIPLKITCTEIELTGERDGIDASFGYYTKGIYVDVGGNLDIHGQEKLSWTKLSETLTPMKPFGLKRFDARLITYFGNFVFLFLVT